MNDKKSFQLSTPEETAILLTDRIRNLRLKKNWKQSTLAERSGVSLASLRRFERTGQISLQSFLQLAFALGRIDDFSALFNLPEAQNISELEKLAELPRPQRGTE